MFALTHTKSPPTTGNPALYDRWILDDRRESESISPTTGNPALYDRWILDDRRESESSIYLKNGLETSPLTVTPVLFLSNGARYGLDPVTLDPSGTSVISINDGLASQGVAPWGILSGYVEITYSWAWNPLCVSVTSVDPVHSTIFTTGFQPSVVSQMPVRAPKVVGGLNTVESLWWKPTADVTGFVALSNTSAQPADAKVKISTENSVQIGEQDVHLSPHGTKIVQLSAMQSFPVGATGGLQIQYTGPGNAMLLNGGLEDQTSGFSANLPFHFFAMPDPGNSTTETYAELGLMTGPADPMMSFPNGTTFTPFSVLRNVGNSPVTVTPTLYSMQGGAALSSQLSPLTVAPLTSVALNVPALLADAGLASFSGSVNLILEVQGPSRSLLLASGSVDAKNTYVFQVFPHGVQESAAKSISYWSTGNGDDTMVTIWNPADEAQDFLFRLDFTGGHYTLPIHLEPRATQTFNISEVIQNQIPDAQGNTIPLGIHEGSAKLSGLHAANEQILVAMDAGTYNVRKATCSWYCISCDGVVTAYVDLGSISPFAVGVQSQFYLHYQWNDGTYYYTDAGSWSSTYTNIATVGTYGLGTGMSPGQTTFNDYYTYSVYNSDWCAYDPFCPYNGLVFGTSYEPVVPTLSLQGNPHNSLFVGTDTHLVPPNSIFATVSPAGGAFTETSSASGDTFTNVQSGGPGWVVHTTTQSTSTGDRNITVHYTVNGQTASQSQSDTARQFAYATNDSPGNICSLGYGSKYVYTYTPYTHPDKVAVQSDLSLDGTPVTESFNPQPPAGAITGSGWLNGNNQFTDTLAYCSTTPLSSSPTVTQTLSIEGYQVRQNSIAFSSTGIALTSQGPAQ